MNISDFQSITETVSKYGDGITTGNIDLLRSAFHPRAMMYGCSGNDITIVEIEGLFDYVAAQTAPAISGEQHRCFIRSVDVADNCASVEVLQENCYGVNYTNYFQLLKIDGQWLIVSKAYDVTGKVTPKEKSTAEKKQAEAI